MSAKELLSVIPVLFQSEKWFVEWKSRLDTKTKEQEELDTKLWKACKDYKWDEAEELIRQGATSDHVDDFVGGYGGLTAYWIMKFENKSSLLDGKFPNESRKAFLSLKFYQDKVIVFQLPFQCVQAPVIYQKLLDLFLVSQS